MSIGRWILDVISKVSLFGLAGLKFILRVRLPLSSSRPSAKFFATPPPCHHIHFPSSPSFLPSGVVINFTARWKKVERGGTNKGTVSSARSFVRSSKRERKMRIFARQLLAKWDRDGTAATDIAVVQWRENIYRQTYKIKEMSRCILKIHEIQKLKDIIHERNFLFCEINWIVSEWRNLEMLLDRTSLIAESS